jgi:hypothetical protein
VGIDDRRRSRAAPSSPESAEPIPLHANPTPLPRERTRDWWERRWLLALLVLVAGLPLAWPDVPPLVDLPGHMAAYKAQLDFAHSPELQRYYSLEWTLIGNLGVNLLVMPLARLIGLEPAVKAIMIAVPMIAVAGFLWTAREAHGRIPPTALFALPLAYNFPFLFGFANYALSMALAFPALALWLRLGRTGRFRLRAALFVPISLILWLAHVYGWAFLCAAAGTIELVRRHDDGAPWRRALVEAGLRCLPLALAVVPLVVWRSGDVGGETAGWFSLIVKANYLLTALRDRWRWLDLLSLAVLAALLVPAWRCRRLSFDRPVAAAALLLFLVYLLLPQRVFGSAYADMRLYPYLLALALIGIRPGPEASRRFLRGLAIAGLGFALLRFGANMASFALYDRAWDRELAALDHVPRGARLVSLVGARCRGDWAMLRYDHLPGLAVVRREAFSNDQWSVPGAQLLQTRYPAARPFETDPSHIVALGDCPIRRWRRLDEALRLMPWDAFDYLWLVAPPPYDSRLTQGLQPVWRSGSSVLYRIPHPPLRDPARASAAQMRIRRPAERRLTLAPPAD